MRHLDSEGWVVGGGDFKALNHYGGVDCTVNLIR